MKNPGITCPACLLTRGLMAGNEEDIISRRNFLTAAAAAIGLVGLGFSVIPFIRAMSPSRDLLALGTIKADISDLSEGEIKSVIWRKQPVFILRRSPRMIKKTEEIDPSKLADPATTVERVLRPDLFVGIGICTHLGCIPGFRPGRVPGLDQPGFYCPCHGGEYDTLGRRLAGPPPENLHLVPYRMTSDTELEIGAETFPGYSANKRTIGALPKE